MFDQPEPPLTLKPDDPSTALLTPGKSPPIALKTSASSENNRRIFFYVT